MASQSKFCFKYNITIICRSLSIAGQKPLPTFAISPCHRFEESSLYQLVLVDRHSKPRQSDVHVHIKRQWYVPTIIKIRVPRIHFRAGPYFQHSAAKFLRQHPYYASSPLYQQSGEENCFYRFDMPQFQLAPDLFPYSAARMESICV